MTAEEKIKQITEIIEAEGYCFNHNMMTFTMFQNYDIERDEIKSFIRLNECSRYEGDMVYITFNVSICSTGGSNRLPVEGYRSVANYLLHMCDVTDRLNAFKLVIHRDWSDVR